MSIESDEHRVGYRISLTQATGFLLYAPRFPVEFLAPFIREVGKHFKAFEVFADSLEQAMPAIEAASAGCCCRIRSMRLGSWGCPGPDVIADILIRES